MKKLINDPRHVVRELLEGLADLAPRQALLGGENVIVQSGLPPPADRPVAVISGGGSGHEPAHAGYVGPGMLAAAVAGDVFTSPSADAILAGLRAAAGPAGAVLVVKNYTGDRLNFALAAELAIREGIPCEIVVVADDVALRELVPPERRRGIAGTVMIHKIAGAAAARGDALAEVARLARAASAALGTMGVALGGCTVPEVGTPGFQLADDEVELGLGIHGEKGVARVKMQPADALIGILLDKIVLDRGLVPGDRVALLVNGLGGTPPMELAIVARGALAWLRAKGLVVERAWSGDFVTSLEMPGCSLSLLKLDEALIALLDADAQAPAWPGAGHIEQERRMIASSATTAPEDMRPAASPGPLAGLLRQAVFAVAAALTAAEPRLAKLDSEAGDGDLGASLARGAAAMRSLPDAAFATPEILFEALGHALRRAIAGSSGPFYATALMRAGRSLKGLAAPDASEWSEAFGQAVAAVSEIGGARPGDRTMIDALQPAVTAFREACGRPHAWGNATSAALAGAEGTATMIGKLGRASYLGDRVIGIPDAGAVAVTIWMQALTPFTG
jgi:dihydroxyacetone kinase